MGMVIEDRAPAPGDAPFELDPGSYTLDRAMRRTVARLSGIGDQWVIPENNDGPRPQVAPYASVLEKSLRYAGGEGNFYSETGDGETLDAVNKIPVAVTYECCFYRTGARDAAKICLQQMTSEVGRQVARSWGIRLGNTDAETRRLDEVVADDWEERVSFEVEVLVDQRISTMVNYFAGPPRIVLKVDDLDHVHTETLYPERFRDESGYGRGNPAVINVSASDAVGAVVP